jgi:bifunctional DNA-binding transcriptional regulator/antitoxin component of YhaV-PrlF toxin-antitoxin module
MTETGAKIAERLLARPQGATMDELIAATGGPQYNVLRRLAAQGHAVRKVREGRVTRYYAAPPARPSFEIAVSPKGQLTLPKALRERLGVANGGTVRYTLQEDGRAFVDAPKKSLKDLFGMLGKPKRHLTLEQIEEEIAKAAIRRFDRAVGREK